MGNDVARVRYKVEVYCEQVATAVVEADDDATEAELTELVLQKCDTEEVCFVTTSGWADWVSLPFGPGKGGDMSDQPVPEARPYALYTLVVKVVRDNDNTAENWKPTYEEVAREIDDRFGYQDLDTGWRIMSVGARL